MKSIVVITTGVILLALAVFYLLPQKENYSQNNTEQMESSEKKTPKKFAPSEWFYSQRAYPLEEIPVEKYFDAMNKKSDLVNRNSMSVSWTALGPTNIGGRVTASLLTQIILI
jgi:hypothetical protein